MSAMAEDEIARRLAAELPEWRHREGGIERRIDTRNWKSTIMLLNAIAFIAEAANHHPDLTASYGHLDVRISTHDAGGVTEKDLSLARGVDALLAKQS